MSWSVFALLFLFYNLQEINCEQDSRNIQNVDVFVSIDMTTSIVKNKYKITFKNLAATPIETYNFELPVEYEALVTVMNDMNETLSYKTMNKENSTTYIINLDKRILFNEICELRIIVIFPSILVPATEFSRYNEEHSFMWKGNRLFYSQYYTDAYCSTFLTNPSFNRNIETSVMYDSTDGEKFTYYARNIMPHSYEESILSFTTPLPVLKVRNLNRNIFVSKFGKIMVQDQIAVQNAGPKLRGPYFNNESQYWLFTHLPSSAESITLSDRIGKNYKTFLYEKNGTKTLKFIPRYSLRQGGWKSSYTLRYKVPVYDYIYQDNNHYYLKIRAMDHILNDVLVEEADVEIILPDGAQLVEMDVPPGFEKENSAIIHTSFSILGRQMIKLKGKLLLEDHINDIIVKYNYSLLSICSSPFYIVFLLETIFLIIILLRKYWKE